MLMDRSRRLSYRLTAFVGLLLIAGTAAAYAIEGEYTARGWNPGVSTTRTPSYTGTVTIERVSVGVYQVQWTIGRQVFAGVGLYDEQTGTLAVSYAELQAGWFGIIRYRVSDGDLFGAWVVYGDTRGILGTEILTDT